MSEVLCGCRRQTTEGENRPAGCGADSGPQRGCGIVAGPGASTCRGAPGTGRHSIAATATRTARLVLFATVLPVGLSAQDPLQIALLRGQVGVEPEPGSLLATAARLEVVRLPLAEALARLSERSRVQVAFSPSLLPTGYKVDCECTDLNMARALDRLLEATDLGYVELGSQVVVVPRGRPDIPAADREAPNRTVTTATLSGVVRDDTSLEPIAFAEVRSSPPGGVARSAAGFSDRFGAFVIPRAPAGPVRIEASAFGYAEWARNYDEFPVDPVEIFLAPVPIALDSLGVEAAVRAGDPISLSRDAFVVDPVMIRATPPRRGDRCPSRRRDVAVRLGAIRLRVGPLRPGRYERRDAGAA